MRLASMTGLVRPLDVGAEIARLVKIEVARQIVEQRKVEVDAGCYAGASTRRSH